MIVQRTLSYLVVLRESGCIINIQPIEYFPFNGLVNITCMSCMNHCTCKVINKLYIAAMECYISTVMCARDRVIHNVN